MFYEENGKQDIDSNVPIKVRFISADSRLDHCVWQRFYRQVRTREYNVPQIPQNSPGLVARVMAAVSNIGMINMTHIWTMSPHNTENIQTN